MGIAIFGLAACGNDSASDSTATASSTPNEFSTGGEDAMADEVAAEEARTSTGGAASVGLPIKDFDRDIITSVHLTMQTSDVRETADDVRRIATSNGGAVFSSDILIGDTTEDGSVPGGGEIIIKIPPQDLDRLVTDLDGIGVVTRLSQDSQDVTEQLVDVDIRIRQAASSIGRIELLLDQAVELDDIFAIETDLAERQVAMERLWASQRNTENLVSLATLTVQVDYRTPSALQTIEESSDGIGDAFAGGWGAFVGALFALGYVLAVASPFLITALIVLSLAWFTGRRVARRQAAAREQQRLDADLAGPTPRYAETAPRHTPPPPVAAQRIDSDVSVNAAPDGDTLIDDNGVTTDDAASQME